MSEYHQDLDSILRWSSGRMAVIWKAYSARQKTISDAIRAATGSGGNTGSAGHRINIRSPKNRSSNSVVEKEARDLRDLSRALRVKPEPYPGTTPFTKEVEAHGN